MRILPTEYVHPFREWSTALSPRGQLWKQFGSVISLCSQRGAAGRTGHDFVIVRVLYHDS